MALRSLHARFCPFSACIKSASYVLSTQPFAAYYTKSKKRGPSKQAWSFVLGGTASFFAAYVFLSGRPDEDLDGKPVVDEFTNLPFPISHWKRSHQRLKDFIKSYTDPAHKTLLPDPLPFPHQPKYTVVIEMKDVLIHSEYNRNEGWKLQKRPGLDYLLLNLVHTFEIVLFTNEVPSFANPIIGKIDEKGCIMYHLYRDSTKYEEGHHVKDLTYLNRDLSKVVIIDTDEKSFKYHKTNGLALKAWNGEIHDTTLFDLTHFLLSLSEHNVLDVRPVLDYYKAQGGDVMSTYRRKREELATATEEKMKQTQTNTKRWRGFGW